MLKGVPKGNLKEMCIFLVTYTCKESYILSTKGKVLVKNTRKIWLLSLSLGLCSSLILIDNFIVDLPDWLAITFAIGAIIALMGFILKKRKINR